VHQVGDQPRLTLSVPVCSIFHTKYIYFRSNTSIYYY